MTITDELAHEARALKLAMCRREPMAEIPDPVLYLVTHAGTWHARTVIGGAPAEIGTVATLLRRTLPVESFATAAIVADSHYKLLDPATAADDDMPRRGDLEAEYGDDPRSTVARALVVYVVTCTGHRDVSLLPYSWDDHGLLEWGDPLELGAEMVTSPFTALACTIVGVQ